MSDGQAVEGCVFLLVVAVLLILVATAQWEVLGCILIAAFVALVCLVFFLSEMT